MDRKMESRQAAPGAAEQAAERAKGQARKTAQDVQQEAQQRAEQGKDTLAKGAEDLSHAGERAAEDLEARGEQDLAEGLRYAAEKLSGLAEGLHRRSANDLMHDAEELARRNPALFIGGSVALGLALSRVFKAGGSGRPERRT